MNKILQVPIRGNSECQCRKFLFVLLTLAFFSLLSCGTVEITKESRVLNNFVTELLGVTGISKPYAEYAFSNPGDGWIFISSTADIMGSGRVTLALDSVSVEEAVIVHEAGKERTQEAMRFLSSGEHKVGVLCEKGTSLKSLTVRAIPEIIYCRYGYGPVVRECGPFDLKFLEKHVLGNVNAIVVRPSTHLPDSLKKLWKRQGKKWIGGCSLPGLREPSEAPGAHGYWTECLHKNPYLDGVIVDEFGPDIEEKPDYQDQYAHWTEAVEKIYAAEEFRDKIFYAYVYRVNPPPSSTPRYLMSDRKQSRSFIQTLMDCNYRISWERYFPELSTEEAARDSLVLWMKHPMLNWRKAQPGVEKHMILCFGLFSTPPASMNKNPDVNYKTWMDMQLNMAANDAAFSDIYGCMWWTSGYADEETIRWEGKLFRHYCIEGKTEMLSKDPYMLTHIENPDFDNGTKGWTIMPVEAGSIEVKSYKDYGKLQGRYYATIEGDNFLWMRRSSKGSNIFSQQIMDLDPGRLYSLKMFTADYRDLIEEKSNEHRHVINIQIEDAEVDADKSFQHVFSSRSPRSGFWMNYHWLVFRAEDNTARLIISDWAGKENPGGPISQELVYNFIEIQPYLED
ncbi:MAG TPA: hypothetical protein ENI20_04965 [Bacteroides sp.]|nr:hypothetical protein [Bacteroides sp.]